jgi:hypothetical protein
VLQTQNAGELERKARTQLDSAQRILNGVTVHELSPNARDQFRNAERFVRLAGTAMVAKNFLYALQLAENANTLARMLAKR